MPEILTRLHIEAQDFLMSAIGLSGAFPGNRHYPVRSACHIALRSWRAVSDKRTRWTRSCFTVAASLVHMAGP
jgi:hypothetical protein